LKSVMDIVTRDPLKDVAAAAQASANQFQAALKNNETAIRSVMTAYDGTTKGAQTLATATQQYYTAQLQLIAGIGAAKQAIDDMFGGTLRNIQLAGMDKQGQFNYYQSEAARLQAEALASDDPQKIKDLASRITQDISAAFALLSPAEQAAQSGAFLERGRAAQTALDARMEQLQKDTANTIKGTLDDLKKLLTAGSEDTKAAAKTQRDAADIQLQAANTPKSLILLLPGNGQQIVTL
jgi:hypothetical protein